MMSLTSLITAQVPPPAPPVSAYAPGSLPNADIRSHWVPVTGPLRDYVVALMAVEAAPISQGLLSIAPHDSLMLTVQFGRDADCIEQKGPQGENTWLTGIRERAGSFAPPGDCFTLFALLTPLGAVHLLESQPLDGVPRIRARVGEVLDRQVTRQLETTVAHATTLEDRLRAFASWIETRALRPRGLAQSAVRAARAAMHVCADPTTPVEQVAAR